MRAFLRRLAFEDRGQDLIEYALLAALIALAAIAVLGPLGTAISKQFTDVKTELDK